MIKDRLEAKEERRHAFIAGLLASVLLASLATATTATSAATKAYAQNEINDNTAIKSKKIVSWRDISQQVDIEGAGPRSQVVSNWLDQFKGEKSNVNIDYRSPIVNAKKPLLEDNIKDFAGGVASFAYSDIPPAVYQKQKVAGQVAYLPQAIDSVAIVYNIPGIPKNVHLRLTGPVLADIFLGKIRSWDDERIKAFNPDLPLPFHNIFVVHRFDPSWTTYVFTDYLSKASPEWKEKVGKGTSVDWPVEFIGMRKGKGRAMGTESVASWASSKPYAIGYVELSHVLANSLPYAALQNKAGNFVEPSQESEKAAIQGYVEKNLLPNSNKLVAWEAISTVDAPGNGSYSLASFASYILVYKELSTSRSINTAEGANALAGFIAWTCISSGQKSLQTLYLAPLPDSVIKLNKESIASLNYKGKPV